MSQAMSDPSDDEPAARVTRRLRAVTEEFDISDELAADAELIEFYRNLKFRGREWDLFLHELLSHGISRTSALLASGAIFTKASKLTRRNVYPDHLRIEDRDREELVIDSVNAALGPFVTKGIVGGGWSPLGGATLRQYFTNACIMSFADRYKVWKRDQRAHLPELAFEQLDDVEAAVIAAAYSSRSDTELALLTDALDRMSKEEIDIFTRIVQGYTQEEIAGKLGKSERAIEGKIYRVRQKLRDLRPANWGRA